MEEHESIHKGFKIFIIVFTALALLFINRERIIDLLQGQNNDLDLIKTIEDDYDYRFFNGEIIKYNDESIAHLEDFTEVKVQKDFGFTQAVLRFANEYIYYADGESGHVYILNNQMDTIGQFNLDMNIFNIYESNKYIMIHSKADSESLYSINTEGNIIYKNSPESSILNYDMGANSYAFSTLLIEDDITSTLHLYDFQGQLLDTMDFENEVIFKITYNGDNILVLTDKSLYMINREILWEKDYPLIKNILVENDKINLLYSNHLEILDLTGQVIDSIELEEDYDMIVSMDNGIILYGDKEILIISDGENYKLGIDDIINSVSGNGKQLIVNTEEYTNIYEFESIEE